MGTNSTQLAEREAEFSDEPADSEVPQVNATEASVLDRLRLRREELRKERHVDIDVPGYKGELVIRYRPVEWKVLRVIQQKVEKSGHPRRELMGQVDTLLEACDQVLIRVDGKLEPISENGPDGFEALPDALGFQAESARQAVLNTFNNDLALVAVHNELAEWMSGSDDETDDDLAGE